MLNSLNNLISVEKPVWDKLPGEIKKFIAEHNRTIRDGAGDKGKGKTKQTKEMRERFIFNH